MLVRVSEYCTERLKAYCANFPFHNLEHTKEVVKNVQTIGEQLGITPDELEPVIIAAWFHDTGFKDAYYGHEAVSIRLATDFLRAAGYPEETLAIVIECIEATRMPQQPSGKLAEIMADADIFHISNESFFYRNSLLRREWEIVYDKYYSDYEWHTLNLQFLLDHQFFTAWGQQVLMEGQHINERKVRQLISYFPEP
jgi:predicted metal-dependent HD superfamily phosphohydrolase